MSPVTPNRTIASLPSGRLRGLSPEDSPRTFCNLKAPVLAAAVTLASLLHLGVSLGSEAPMSQPAGQGVYASFGGSASCAECHPQACEDWARSHHAKAQRGMRSGLDREAFEPAQVILHGSQLSFAVMEAERFSLVTMGSDGRRQAFEPIGAIGVDPLWQYLIPVPGGRLQVTELAFDPARKEWFDVYGHEDRKAGEWGHWTGRGMNWNSMCAPCHTTGFRKNYEPEQDAYRSTYMELGVGCEQCHGPMSAHNAWQRIHKDQKGDPTIRPMDRQKYFSVCGSCHARRVDLTGSFAVGDEFSDHYELMVPDPTDLYYPDGQVHDEDFEFAAFNLSYMQQWGVRCTDCHQWHTGKPARRDNRLCLRCHEHGITTKIPIDEVQHSFHPRDKGGFLCVDCHMPVTFYMQRHPRRDHGMTIPDPELTRDYGVPNACTRCHEDQGLQWSIDYVRQWYGPRMNRPTGVRSRLLARLKKNEGSAVAEVVRLLKGEENPSWRAAYARFLAPFALQARDGEARRGTLEALGGLLEDAAPLPQAVAIESLEPFAGVIAEPLAAKLQSPSRLVRIKAAWALRARLDLQSPAGTDLMGLLAVSRDQPTGALHQATLWMDRGQAQDALPWYEKAIAWDSAAAPARHGLAVALQSLGRSEDAIVQLRKAAEVDPAQSAYPYGLGLLYAELGRISEARDAIQAAIEKDPHQSRYWYNLGLAEAQLDRPQVAIEAIQRAELMEPDVADYAFARATIHQRLGQRLEAEEALRRALSIDPNHPGARAAIRGGNP